MSGDTRAPLLAGLRVLDLGGDALAFAGRMLAQLGAEVILLEPPTGELRAGSAVGDALLGGTPSPSFVAMAAGKRSLTIDRSTEQGRRIVLDLMPHVDVLLSTDGLDELDTAGLRPTLLLERCPRLVFVSATPFGLRGPRRHWKGSDLVAWATSAAMPAQGDPDRAPLAPAGGLADIAASLNAIASVTVALRARQRSGSGQLVDISNQEAMMSCAVEAGPLVDLDHGRIVRRTGARKPNPPNGHFRARDGTVALVAFMGPHWDALAAWIHEETGCTEVLDESLRGSPLNRRQAADQVDAWVESLTRRYGKQEFSEAAQRRGIPCTPLNTVAELLDDPHLAATQALVPVAVPGFGLVRMVQPPFVFDGERGVVGPVPELGADTSSILAEHLHVSDEQIAAWRTEKIV